MTRVIPQVELGEWGARLGGAKKLVQRSGILANKITMMGAMTAAYSTTPQLQAVFPSFWAFVAAAWVCLGVWMALDYIALLPAEMSFTQGQAHGDARRSPLKRDTEAILDHLRDDSGGRR